MSLDVVVAMNVLLVFPAIRPHPETPETDVQELTVPKARSTIVQRIILFPLGVPGFPTYMKLRDLGVLWEVSPSMQVMYQPILVLSSLLTPHLTFSAPSALAGRGLTRCPGRVGRRRFSGRQVPWRRCLCT